MKIHLVYYHFPSGAVAHPTLTDGTTYLDLCNCGGPRDGDYYRETKRKICQAGTVALMELCDMEDRQDGGNDEVLLDRLDCVVSDGSHTK